MALMSLTIRWDLGPLVFPSTAAHAVLRTYPRAAKNEERFPNSLHIAAARALRTSTVGMFFVSVLM